MPRSKKIEAAFEKMIKKAAPKDIDIFITDMVNTIENPKKPTIHSICTPEDIDPDGMFEEMVHAFEAALKMEKSLEDLVSEKIYNFSFCAEDIGTVTIYLVARSEDDAINILESAIDPVCLHDEEIGRSDMLDASIRGSY